VKKEAVVYKTSQKSCKSILRYAWRWNIPEGRRPSLAERRCVVCSFWMMQLLPLLSAVRPTCLYCMIVWRVCFWLVFWGFFLLFFILCFFSPSSSLCFSIAYLIIDLTPTGPFPVILGGGGGVDGSFLLLPTPPPLLLLLLLEEEGDAPPPPTFCFLVFPSLTAITHKEDTRRVRRAGLGGRAKKDVVEIVEERWWWWKEGEGDEREGRMFLLLP